MGGQFLKTAFNILVPLKKEQFDQDKRKTIEYFDGSCYLSTISLKNFHLFKIAELVINFCLKKISN